MVERKPDGFWLKEKNVLRSVKQVMRKHHLSFLPNAKKLIDLGYVGIVYAIEQHHDGFRAFRKRIGEKQRIGEKGQWKSLDFVLEQTNNILKLHHLEQLPETKRLIELGHADYVAGVQRYHCGLQMVREKLGHRQYMQKRKVWQGEQFAITEAIKVMKELNLEELPSTKVLHSKGYSTLGSSIVRYHGGMISFRDKLRKYQNKSSQKEQTENLLEGYVNGR